MAQFANSLVLDNGLNYIRDNCTQVMVVSAYTFGDSYATVIGNLIAESTTAPSDFTLGTSGNDRTLTFSAAIQDASANATAAASHIAFLDVTGTEVLWVAAETSGQTITTGNPVTFPALVYTSNQPTLV